MRILHACFDFLLFVGAFIAGIAMGQHIGQEVGQPSFVSTILVGLLGIAAAIFVAAILHTVFRSLSRSCPLHMNFAE
ncbi:MAG: hypothetical protein AAB652_02235 [Patescibacteria group bacterium]